jgi:putative colanic acid polymerase
MTKYTNINNKLIDRKKNKDKLLWILSMISTPFILAFQLNIGQISTFYIPLALPIVIIFILLSFQIAAGLHKSLAVFPIVAMFLIVKSIDSIGYAASEVLNTLLLLIFTLFCVTVATTHPLHPSVPQFVISISRFSFFSLSIMLTIQAILVNFVGLSQLAYPLGDQIIYGQIPESSLEDSFGLRASAAYIEPSYAMLVLFVLFYCSAWQKIRAPQITAIILAALATRSAAGLLSFIIVLIFFYVRTQSKSNFGSKVLFFVFAVLAWFGLLSARLAELGSSGSSGYYRINASWQAAVQVLKEYPFGIPLGSVEDFMYSMGVLNGEFIGTSVDNGLAMLVIYFGWIFVFICILIMFLFYFRRKYFNLEMLVTFILCLQFTGGIFLPDFALLSVLIIASAKSRSQLLYPKKRFVG